MKEKKKTKKKSLGSVLSTLMFLVIGGVCGGLISYYAKNIFGENMPLWQELLILIAYLFVLYLCLVVHIVLHEAGHLLFGLFSGYRFGSFRIMSFMWIRENRKLKMKRLSLVGTAGQCLMCPPSFNDGSFPSILYNLGGVLVNLFCGFLSVGLFFAFANAPFLSLGMLFSALIAFIMALTNGIPMHSSAVDNDGYNALSLGKNKAAKRAFWVQMKIGELSGKGIRLRDMPSEFFTMPSDDEMSNSMTAALAVFACNRMVDEQKFDEADSEMARIMAEKNAVIGLHRNLMMCDRIFIECIGERRQDRLDEMLTVEQKAFMNAMKKFLSVIRTEYVLSLLVNRDNAEAEKLLARFEKQAARYPYAADVESERELIALAQRQAMTLENNGSYR